MIKYWSNGKRESGRTGSKRVKIHGVGTEWAAWIGKKVEGLLEPIWILKLEEIRNEVSGKRAMLLNHGKAQGRKGVENLRPDPNQFDGQQL